MMEKESNDEGEEYDDDDGDDDYDNYDDCNNDKEEHDDDEEEEEEKEREDEDDSDGDGSHSNAVALIVYNNYFLSGINPLLSVLLILVSDYCNYIVLLRKNMGWKRPFVVTTAFLYDWLSKLLSEKGANSYFHWGPPYKVYWHHTSKLSKSSKKLYSFGWQVHWCTSAGLFSS